MKKFPYLWSTSKTEVIITVALFILSLIWVGTTNNDIFSAKNMDSWYAGWIDPVVTVATLLVAVFVWYNHKMNDWVNDLPKKLNVHFKKEDQYILSCYRANLVSENDIRAVAQQIGAQMNEGKFLKFSPIVEPKPPKTVKNKKQQYFRQYEIEFSLIELPAAAKGKYLVWIVDDEDIHDIGEDELDHHPDQPYHLLKTKP